MNAGMTHLPMRPAWICGHCFADWPCAPAKVELAEHHVDRSALVIFMALQMWDAFDDGIGETARVPIPPDLHGRFMGWLFVYQNLPSQRNRHAA